MHICQDEVLAVGWIMAHARHAWVYVIHAWHLFRERTHE